MTRWLVIVEDDLEPSVRGPFRSDGARVAAARRHRGNDVGDRDGLFRLDISAKGSPRISHFLSRELDSGAT